MLSFDPIQHSIEVEKLVMQDDKRRYYRFDMPNSMVA